MTLHTGSRGPLVQTLQQGLTALGFNLGTADGIYGAKTHAAVEDWQASTGKLYPDGIFGSASAALWNNLYPTYTIALGDAENPAAPSKLLKRVNLPADPFGDGYNLTSLREDIAPRYREIYQEVKALGGKVTSAGGYRSLRSAASAARALASMHYVGRAFDLAVYSGMQNTSKDAYIITEAPRGCTEVWCKTDDPAAPVVTLEALTVTQSKVGGVRKSQVHKTKWEGRAFSFNKIAEKHGFVGINGRRDFWNGGSYAGAEWWHFQCDAGLTPKVSTFGEDLLKCYTLEEIEKNFKLWQDTKGRVYKVSWF